MHICKETYYLKNGRAVTESDGGKNPVLLLCGAVVSDEQADKLGLPRKDAQRDREAVAVAQESAEPVEVAKTAAKKEAK